MASSQDPGPARPPAGPVIDTHVHITSPELIRDRERYLERDAWFRLLYTDPKARLAPYEQLVKEMDATGVDVSVVFGFAFRDQALCREANDYVLEAMRAYPERFIGFACVSPEMPGAVEELERCLDAGMRGAGELFPDGQQFDLGCSPDLDRVAGVLTERGLPLNLHSNEAVGHTYPGKGDNTPGPCYRFAARHPDLTIIYAHLGGGLFFYELMPSVRQALARVYYDTAAAPYLYRSDVYALGAQMAGADKLVFGSDYPLLSPARYLKDTAYLDPSLRDAIFSGNPQAALGLAPVGSK
jgi:predicted TIM-barrel fold metal-dependent hydrolase